MISANITWNGLTQHVKLEEKKLEKSLSFA